MPLPISRNKLLTYSVPTLLLLVAGVQVLLAHFSTLSPWKGGGFGMFSRISVRALACDYTQQDGEKRTCRVDFRGQGELGPFTRTRYSSLKTFPTRAKLESILDDYAKYDVKVVRYAPKTDDKAADQAPPEAPRSMSLEVYQLSFNNSTLAIEMRPIPGVKAVRENMGRP